MGGLITRHKPSSSSDSSSSYHVHLSIGDGGRGGGGGGSGGSGSLADLVVDGILNLENRGLTHDMVAKMANMHHVTKQVISLSLANNRLTCLVFDESSPAVPSSSGAAGGAGAAAAAAVAAASQAQQQQAKQQSDGASVLSIGSGMGLLGSSLLHGSVDELGEDSLELDRESSVLRPGGSTPAKPLAQASQPVQLHASINWPNLENLDLSSNTDLFNYSGLKDVSATLKSLRLANNGIFKVPTEVWGLAQLTKLDLSHNRLQTVPAGISLLTQLNSLKLSHNALIATTTTSCIPEEMKFCSRLRRLDLSHNKLKELPVNWRVDKENQQRGRAALQAPRTKQPAGRLPPVALPPGGKQDATSTLGGGKWPTDKSAGGLRGGGTFGKLEPINKEAVTSSSATQGEGTSASAAPSLVSHRSSSSTISSPHLSSSSSPYSSAPLPIKYFDPNRISFLQVTLLNLSNNQLDSLSPSIGLLRSLNSLNLGYNKLRSLPTEIALLTELKYLDLRFNQLPSLLPEICSLPRLSKLCVQNNKISSLPYEIRRLKSLTHLLISSNQLVDLPDVIAEVRNVRVLKLCNNKLLTIPDSLFRLQKLRLLDLSFNRLTYISPDVCHMPLIEDLRLWGNKIADLPAPMLYADVKKIIAYLQAGERDKFIMRSQMGARGGAGGVGGSYNRHPKTSPSHSRLSRARSATRAASCVVEERGHRFAPLGFFNDDVEDDGPAGARNGRSASALSGALAPSRDRRPKEAHSDNEDMDSDDEFTSMFKAGTARAHSFTHLFNAHAEATRKGSHNSSGANTRRQTTLGRLSASAGRSRGHPSAISMPVPSSSPREGAVLSQPSTLVQPFVNQFQAVPPQSGAHLSSSPSRSPMGSGRQALHSIRDRAHAGHLDSDLDVDDEEVDPLSETEADRAAALEREKMERGSSILDRNLTPGASPHHTDVLTDLVKREWPREAGAASIPSATNTTAANTQATAGLTLPPLQTQQQPGAAELMEQWDMQSMAIEQQQNHTKGAARQRIGAL